MMTLHLMAPAVMRVTPLPLHKVGLPNNRHHHHLLQLPRRVRHLPPPSTSISVV